MGVDTASGNGAKDADDSAAIVLEAETLQEVASFHSTALIPAEFAQKVAALGALYKGKSRHGCFIVPETGPHGDVVIEILRSVIRYSAMYAERRGTQFDSFQVDWGWKSTQASRSDLIDRARERFKEVCTPEYLAKYGPAIRTKKLVEQIPKFIFDDKDKATTSKKRGHDDLIIAWCLACLGRDEALRRVAPTPVQEKPRTYETDVQAWIRGKIDAANRRIGISDWRAANAASRELELLRMADAEGH